jgi:hypothetical protein
LCELLNSHHPMMEHIALHCPASLHSALRNSTTEVQALIWFSTRFNSVGSSKQVTTLCVVCQEDFELFEPQQL